MKSITQNLQRELKSHLKNADEIWIAVALLTKKGLEFLQENLPKSAKQNYLLGVDLPTDPDALAILCKQQLLNDVSVRMYYNREFYHPKVYIIRTKRKLVAFVGSANCTTNGLFSNIELSFIITNQTECIELLNWFKRVELSSSTLKATFIEEYRLTYRARFLRKKEDEKLAKAAKEKLKEEYEATMSSRKALIKKIKRYRANKNYTRDKEKRFEDIRDLKKSLDYPNFNNVDIDAFFENYALGHLIAIPKPTLKKEKVKFKKMLQVLTDDSIDVSIRFNRAFKGDLYIRGVGVATITKILTLHNPREYCVSNDKIDSVLNEYGIEFPSRISKGDRYKATNKFLLEICNETDIDDLSILDYYLYTAANE